ncbi:heterokaryon incompatibility domain-containing protein [Trichoderma evansii]
MPIFNKYHYEPLCAEDAIRLIVLNAAAGRTAPLSCSLIQCRRSAPMINYNAISYAWGKPEFSRSLEIRCDGDTSYLRITPNVDALLRRIRASNKLRYLWIDAICLNQDDEVEKAEQIPLMGRIYEEAKSGFIWLGPDNYRTAMLFTFFREANLLPEVEKEEMAERFGSMSRRILRDGVNKYANIVYLTEFFDQPWFSRRWVIQEAYLARQATVFCGNYSIPLSELHKVARRIQTLDLSWYQVAVMANLDRSADKHGILELLWTFHKGDCLERKDRIAALFGLIPKNDRFPLDYKTHWTDIFKQLALFLFSLGDKNTNFQMLLHLFEFGPISQSEDALYPSWVPDWSRTRRRILPYYSYIRNPDTWEQHPSSPRHSEKTTLSFHQGVLHVNWHSSISGPQGRQAIYVKTFDGPLCVEEQREERVIGLLHDLFHSISASTLQIIALSSLLDMVAEFCYTPKKCEDARVGGPDIDIYINHLSALLPRPLNAMLFDNLRLLDSILQEFCLFQIEPFKLSPELGWGYGIGPAQIQVGDTMIPLWRPERRLRGRGISLQIEEKFPIRIITMLAVRPHETGAQGKEKAAQKGRIIGPSICVILRRPGGYRQDQDVDVKLDSHVNMEQWYSMCIV